MFALKFEIISLAFLICFGAILNCVSSGDLPASIKKCRPGDGPCIAKTINDILHRYPKGNSEFGLENVDELELKNFVVAKSDGDTPVQLNMKFNSLKVYGIENTIVQNVVGFERNPNKSKFEIYATIPNLRVKGDYDANGRVLLLPLTGKGPAEISLKNAKFGFKIKPTFETRNGKTYAKISKVKSTLEPEKMFVNLEKLFGGNRELGDSINKVINENWRDVWSELEHGINGAVSDVIKKLMVNILQELSYDDFFRND